MVLKGVNCLIREMVLKEPSEMNTQCNVIMQFLCKNSIETIHRQIIFGKYMVLKGVSCHLIFHDHIPNCQIDPNICENL